MSVYPNTGQFDMDLQSSRQGWSGTFNVLIRTAAQDILSDGEPYGPVEVTYPARDNRDSRMVPFVLEGVLTDSDSDTLFIDAGGRMHSIEIDAIERLRA